MDYLVAPWQHQLTAIERARGKKCYGLWFEMGCGKTSTAINIFRERCNEQKRLMRTLIFAPPIVLPNWKREFGVHSKLEKSKITVLNGTGAHRLKTFRETAWNYSATVDYVDPKTKTIGIRQHKPEPAPHVFVTNYESLQMEELSELFQEWKPECVILDECHRLKDRRGVRAKRLNKICNPGTKNTPLPRPFVMGLSGSPILKDPEDIFFPYLLMDGGETFGNSFSIFKNKYYVDKNAGWKASGSKGYFPQWKVLEGSTTHIGKLMEKYSMRVEKKDCLDLPDLVKETVFVEMTPDQRKAYKEMQRDLVAFFEKDGKEHVTVATMALTKSLRLMQLASGFIKADDGQELALTAGLNPKQLALEEILTDIARDHKVLIWATWKQNYQQIREVLEKLKIKFVEVHGDVSDKQKHANVDQFSTDAETRVLLGHPGSGGIGINLVAASYSIFYSRNFSLEQDLQAEARNHRGGSEIHQKITRIDLVTKDSIEEKIVEALAQKMAISNDVLREITLTNLERLK